MRRILLVDDELPVLLTLQAVLELNGFTVTTAASAAEAVQKLTTGVYDLVITDLRMETATAGYNVIRVAKAQSYAPATAILTAYPSLGGHGEPAGAQQLLVKPVGTGDLLRQLEHVMARHQAQKLAQAREPHRAAPAPAGGNGGHHKAAS